MFGYKSVIRGLTLRAVHLKPKLGSGGEYSEEPGASPF